MSEAENFHYEGFTSPNGTIVPDDVFDLLAPLLTEAELRVLLYIIRRTFGFKKDSDTISLKQMVEGIHTRDGRVLDRGAGLAKSAAARGVKGLVEKGIITATRNRSAEKGDEPTSYALRFRSSPVFSKETRGVPQKEHGGVLPANQGGVLFENPQQTVEQETARQQTAPSLLRRDGDHSNSKGRTHKRSPRRVEEDNPSPLAPTRRSSATGFTRIGALIQSAAAPPRRTANQHATSVSLSEPILQGGGSQPVEPPARRAQKAKKAPQQRRVEQTTPPDANARSLATGAPQTPPETAIALAETDAEELLALDATIQELSEKLGNGRAWRSNVTQARRLYAASGLNRNAFTGLVWSAYHDTNELRRAGRVRKPAAYFFKRLRDAVDEKTNPARRQSLMASFSEQSGAPPRPSLAGKYARYVRR